MISILGPLRILSSGGQEIVLTSRRQRKVLAALVLNQNAIVSTTRLVDVVWPTEPPATAHKQIQNCIGLMRRHLQAALVDVDVICHPSGYKIVIPANSLDSATFVKHLGEAQKCLSGKEETAAAKHLRAALALWRGDVLEGLFSGEMLPARVHLEELRVGAFSKLVELTERSGETDLGLIADLRRWGSNLPYHEEPVRALARIMSRAGRTSDALEIIRQHKKRMADDLGIDIRAVTAQLEQQLLRSDDPPRSSKASETVEAVRNLIAAALEQLLHANRLLSSLGYERAEARPETTDRGPSGKGYAGSATRHIPSRRTSPEIARHRTALVGDAA